MAAFRKGVKHVQIAQQIASGKFFIRFLAKNLLFSFSNIDQDLFDVLFERGNLWVIPTIIFIGKLGLHSFVLSFG